MSYSNKMIKLKGDDNLYKVLTDMPHVSKVLILKDGDIQSVPYDAIEIIDIVTKVYQLIKYIISLFKKQK